MKGSEEIAKEVVDAAFQVHQQLGPRLLESAYEICLYHELTTRNLKVERQLQLPIIYKNIKLDAGYRLDLIVEDCIIIEIKAVEKMEPIHNAQLLTYLKLSKKSLGFLINFNTDYFKGSIKRVVNNYQKT